MLQTGFRAMMGVKVHGSDLSYTVLPELDRFRPYAEEAVDRATCALVGSVHIAERLRAAVDAEYLGLRIPGAALDPVERTHVDQVLEHGLRQLGATPEILEGTEPSG